MAMAVAAVRRNYRLIRDTDIDQSACNIGTIDPQTNQPHGIIITSKCGMGESRVICGLRNSTLQKTLSPSLLVFFHKDSGFRTFLMSRLWENFENFKNSFFWWSNVRKCIFWIFVIPRHASRIKKR